MQRKTDHQEAKLHATDDKQTNRQIDKQTER